MTKTKPDLRAVPEAEWTDEHEAELRRRVAEDPNDWMPSEAELAQAKPFAEAFPDLAQSLKRPRGRPPVETPRKHISLRLDPDVIAKFRATGKGWQSRINAVLRKAKVN